MLAQTHLGISLRSAKSLKCQPRNFLQIANRAAGLVQGRMRSIPSDKLGENIDCLEQIIFEVLGVDDPFLQGSIVEITRE
jgi:hypothetical protein